MNQVRLIWNGNLGNLQISDEERARVAHALRKGQANLAMAARRINGDCAALYNVQADGKGFTAEKPGFYRGFYAEITWLCFACGTPGEGCAYQISKVILAPLPEDISVVLSLIRGYDTRQLLTIPDDIADGIHLVSNIAGENEYNLPLFGIPVGQWRKRAHTLTHGTLRGRQED